MVRNINIKKKFHPSRSETKIRVLKAEKIEEEIKSLERKGNYEEQNELDWMELK